jgi:hypothetical protein
MPFSLKHGAIVDGDTTLYLRHVQISRMNNDIDFCRPLKYGVWIGKQSSETGSRVVNAPIRGDEKHLKARPRVSETSNQQLQLSDGFDDVMIGAKAASGGIKLSATARFVWLLVIHPLV